MTEITSIKEIQKIELDILVAFDQFCKKNNIKYSLFYGTLLGAVRHKGFIPWDNDVDIVLVREEYEKFLTAVKKSNNKISNIYDVLIPLETENYMYPFIKIIDNRTYLIERALHPKKKYNMGVHIDLFPLDYAGNDKKKIIKAINSGIRNKVFLLFSCTTSHLNALIVLANKIKHRDEVYWIKKCTTFQRVGKSNYMLCMVWPENCKSIFNTEWFQNYIMIEFENHKFLAFKDYDSVLRQSFGEYMILPPEKDRETHDILAFWK